MEVKFELKYCEICGSLGMRRPQSPLPYCEECARLLALRPIRARSLRRRPARATSSGRTPQTLAKEKVTA